MSGGVDSSVAALLLKEWGYEVIGVTLNLWSYAEWLEPYNECCSLEVSAVTKQLGIAHHFLDYGALFKEKVVNSFIAEYLRGRTPNPCIWCNQCIRFPLLLEEAERLGCDYLATGHHARIEKQDGRYYLKRGKDSRKDQSYFLYGLTQRELPRLLFPIGDYRKEEVQEIAEGNRLVAIRKRESQDLCFAPDGDYRRFLTQIPRYGIKKGEIVDLEGNVLGEHRGLPFYTIGQRRGLGLGSGAKAYVVKLEPKSNRVIVGGEEDLYAEGLIATDTNFIYIGSLKEPEQVEVKVRYRSRAVEAVVKPVDSHEVEVSFAEPQRAITPGQAAVFYKGDLVFGGGTIERAL